MKVFYIISLVIISALQTSYSQSWFQQTSGVTNQLESVFFINENLGWIVGDNGEFLKTTNGGTNWINMPQFTTLILTSVFFINENVGWATVYYNQGEIHKTTDGGNTWVRQHQTTFPGYWSIQFINPDTGWAIYGENDYAKIMKTTNGGSIWYQVYIDSYAYSSLQGLFFLNSEIGWVVGDYKVLKSTDRGENWILKSTISGSDLQSVCFINDSVGWVSGTNGIISKTSNGGTSWISQNSQTTGAVYDIQFINENIGWAVGYGIILKTVDGGNNWIPSLGGYTHRSLYFVNENIGWVVGQGGRIFKTSDGGAIPVELNSFTVYYLNCNIRLNWSTASELNNRGFEIERSTNKTDWRLIGFKEGNGTTTETHNYSFVDDLYGTSSSKLYYRLKQIDFNGSFKYSNVVEIEIEPTKFVLYQNYPNPFNPSTKISWQSPVSSWQTLKVFDVLGREVATLVDEYRDAGSYNIEFRIQNLELSSGIYFYQLKAGDFVETKKMLLLK